MVIYEWSRATPANVAAYDNDLNPSTIQKIYQKCNEISKIIINNLGSQVIGGENTIVVIDEALFVKRKYHNGRILSNQGWVIGGIVKGNNNDFFLSLYPTEVQILLQTFFQGVLLQVVHYIRMSGLLIQPRLTCLVAMILSSEQFVIAGNSLIQ